LEPGETAHGTLVVRRSLAMSALDTKTKTFEKGVSGSGPGRRAERGEVLQ